VGDVEAAEVGAVVGVQMAEEDRIEVVQVDVSLEGAERPRAEVEQDVPRA
jgi:hypothetical protein